MSLRQRLQARSPVVATFVLIPRIEVVEGLGRSGFDAVILDLEHGPYGVPDLPPLVAAAHGAGLQVLARVGNPSAAAIGVVLDTGADGIVVPHVASAATAAAAVDAVRFPPDGSRSLNPYVRAAGYDASDAFLDDANSRVALLVMVEGTDGVAALDDLVSTPGVDGVFVGPVDLSASLGHPGQPEHPDVIDAVRELIKTAAASECAVGVYSPSPEAASRWFDAGATLVALSADVAMALNGFRHFRSGVDHGQMHRSESVGAESAHDQRGTPGPGGDA